MNVGRQSFETRDEFMAVSNEDPPEQLHRRLIQVSQGFDYEQHDSSSPKRRMTTDYSLSAYHEANQSMPAKLLRSDG